MPPFTDARDRAAKASKSKDLPWFQANVGSTLTPEGRELLEKYSGVPPDQVVSHVYETRDKAWEIFPWPCVGEFWFTSLGFSQHPYYPTLVQRLRSTSPPLKYLDMGTCLGQDLRKLAFDGVPTEQLYGVDVFPEYEGLGHYFFRDADRFKGRYITGDLFSDDPEDTLVKSRGTWDIIETVMFLHIWDWDLQVAAGKRLLRLLKPNTGMIVGEQTGSTESQHIELKPPHTAMGEERKIFRHNLDSFRQMWDQIQKEEGIPVKVEAEYDSHTERSKLIKESEAGERTFFFPPSGVEVKLFFTIELLPS